MEKPTWGFTFATQLALCFALYLALNIGQPQKPIYENRSERKPIDMYFISVRGGFRPLKEQTHLLKLMEKVMKMYKPRFVVNISELGEDDPLLQNATWYFLHSLKVPWYTTRALKGQEAGYFVKQIKIPFGEELDIIVLHTGSLQDSSSGNRNDQLHWLTKTLQASNSDWRIVVGVHPLVGCDENLEQMESKSFLEPVHHILLKYGVDAYLSGQACTDYVQEEGMPHINNMGAMVKGPYLTSLNKKQGLHRDIFKGFLLHRVSSLEIVTYLVTLTGEVVHQTSQQQRGREVM